jgi:hypothetical protein
VTGVLQVMVVSGLTLFADRAGRDLLTMLGPFGVAAVTTMSVIGEVLIGAAIVRCERRVPPGK